MKNRVQEAIKKLLKQTEQEWTDYFEGKKENALLELSCSTPERKSRIKKILTWIIEAQTNGNYDDLVKKWNDGQDYNAEYDFDGSLNALMQYLRMLKGEKTINLPFP